MNKKRFSKKGNILTENIIFILLNLIFLSILLFFIVSKTGEGALLEEMYAKKIALALDAAKPGMEINLFIEKAVEESKENNWEGKIIFISDNIVTVKLKEDSLGYSYSFFNNIKLTKEYHYVTDGDKFSFVVEGYK